MGVTVAGNEWNINKGNLRGNIAITDNSNYGNGGYH